MVTRPASFCDVMMAQGKVVIATKKRNVVIPAVAMPDGKTFRKTLDVSAEGEKVLEQMVARMQQRLLASSKEFRDMGEATQATIADMGGLTAKPVKESRESGDKDSDAGDQADNTSSQE